MKSSKNADPDKNKGPARMRARKAMIKSVSLPEDLAEEVDALLATDPELTFSSLVRSLIREKLNPAK